MGDEVFFRPVDGVFEVVGQGQGAELGWHAWQETIGQVLGEDAFDLGCAGALAFGGGEDAGQQ
ncbi:hypothetical protein AB4212_60075, partial [Streptomyces sp. 2MCAF27]